MSRPALLLPKIKRAGEVFSVGPVPVETEVFPWPTDQLYATIVPVNGLFMERLEFTSISIGRDRFAWCVELPSQLLSNVVSACN